MIFLERKEIFDLSLDIAQAIIKSGGEINRAKDTVIRINKAYGKSCSVFAIPTLIIAQSSDNIGIRKINTEDTDLSELSRLNELSRRLCSEYNEEINITRNKLYPISAQMAAVCLATASFCLYFGGNVIDAVFSSLTGIIITYLNYKKPFFPLFSSNLIDSFVAGLISFLPSIAGIKTHPDKIMVGTIMLLVPGLTVVNAMRDMMSGEPVAGLIELFNAIMSALGIALGFAGAVIIFT